MGLQRLQDVERCLLVTPVTPAIFEGLQLRPAPVLARTHVTPVTLENNEVRDEFNWAFMCRTNFNLGETMIKPDLAPDQDEPVGPHPPDKTQGHRDLDFLQRCFKDALCGEIENWPVETFREYRATLSRLDDLLGLNGSMPALKLTYGERFAGMAILELSRKISASWKGRNVMDQLTGLKH